MNVVVEHNGGRRATVGVINSRLIVFVIVTTTTAHNDKCDHCRNHEQRQNAANNSTDQCGFVIRCLCDRSDGYA